MTIVVGPVLLTALSSDSKILEHGLFGFTLPSAQMNKEWQFAVKMVQ